MRTRATSCSTARTSPTFRSSKRNIGFVFQNYALFRHLTVADNIAFGLNVMKRRDRLSHADRNARVEELLDLVRLEGLGKRFPAQLSGGQRQRVALARALARKPRFLLLDEPFGALDAKVRQELRGALRTIHDQLGLTSIFVTHDREEAFALADTIAILNDGRIEQYGTPPKRSTTRPLPPSSATSWSNYGPPSPDQSPPPPPAA